MIINFMLVGNGIVVPLYHLVSNFNFQRILFVVVEEDLDGYFKVLLAFCLVSVDDFIVLCGWLDVHL